MPGPKRSTIFVGREKELEQWDKLLADPCGLAVLIVGQPGMGKSTLVDQMVKRAKKAKELACGAVRYEVTPNIGPYGTMEAMIEDAFEAADTIKPFLSGGTKDQWQALFKTLGVIPLVGHSLETMGELIASLRRNPQRDTREQLIERLYLISNRIKENGRAIFIVDAAKELPDKSDQDWALVVERLPPKIKLVFTQRPYDVIAQSSLFRGLSNKGLVARLPADGLDRLDESAATLLIEQRAAEMYRDPQPLLAALTRYQGHPYALDGALGLIAAGKPVNELPADPTPEAIAAEQWKMICGGGANRQLGDKAVQLFLSYAVLEVPVPDDVADAVAEVSHAERTALLSDTYIGTLLKGEGEKSRIYHAILADHIREVTNKSACEPYHRRAIDLFRGRLLSARESQTAPDALSAQRLPEHVLALESSEAFVSCFIDECTPPLLSLGLYDVAQTQSYRAMRLVPDASVESAVLHGNLGLLMIARGDLNTGEKMHRKALEIHERLGQHAGMANAYGNIALVLKARGDLKGAEKMHRMAIAIDEKLGRLEGIANDYNNLALVLRTCGDLDGAENMHRKSLTIAEKLGTLQVVASTFANLGIVLVTRGDLDGAQKMFRRSLEINERLGRLVGMAVDYANLGNVLVSRSDFDGAEQMYRKALEIDEKLGRLAAMAAHFANLGIVYQKRGDFLDSERMCRKALEINERLGLLEGMADQFGNLGNVLVSRSDFDGAERMYRKALAIDEKLGRLVGMATTLCNLGNVLQASGKFDWAEQMYRNALEIDEKLGRLEGLASEYGNLGGIYAIRGNLDLAEEMLRKSIAIDEKLGRLENIAIHYCNLGSLYKQRGDKAKAGELWTKSRDLFAKIGIPHMVAQVEGCLKSLDKPKD